MVFSLLLQYPILLIILYVLKLIFCLDLGCLAESLYVQRLSWNFIHFLQMIRMHVILIVKLLKGQLLLRGLCMGDFLNVLTLLLFSILLFLIVQIELNPPVLLNILFIGLLSFFFLFELHFIYDPQIRFDKLFVSEFFHNFLLRFSSNVLLDLLFVLICKVAMNGFWDVSLLVLDVMMKLVHFVDMLKLLFF